MLSLFFLLFACHGLVAEAAKCEVKCGNVKILFPFGMGSKDCFLDEWFEIVCDKKGTTPRLKKLNLEVTEVSPAVPDKLDIEYWQKFVSSDHVVVRQPIVYSNCTGREASNRNLNLQGSPFSLSTRNVFVAVGCNNIAMMVTTDSGFVGCQSRCSHGSRMTDRYSNCTGIGCCQTANLNSFGGLNRNFEFELKGQGDYQIGEDAHCSYAFLASQNWLSAKRPELDLLGIEHEQFIPMVLDWSLDEAAIKKLGLSVASNYSEPAPYVRHPYRLGSADDEIQHHRRFTCCCNPGYIGNAYLNQCIGNGEGPPIVDPHDLPGALLISSGAEGVLILLVMWLYQVLKKRRQFKLKQKNFKRNGGLILQQKRHSSGEGNYVDKGNLFNSNDLEKATDNFSTSRILGQGGQGTVYKGMLKDGTIAAIKKSIAMDDERSVEQFINEVIILSEINHRNVVKLLGYCLETDVPLLVYEFIPNGTLYQYLHDPDENLFLYWEKRLQIAVEVAGAISYLHSASSPPVYHRDIKSHNILLDEKYRAKVADFGTSKSISIDQSHETTIVAGTFGYLDPEYFRSGQFTDKSDVYSFGVVLAELLTGQKSISLLRPEEHRGLAAYFLFTMEEDRLFDIVDARVLQQDRDCREEIAAVARLAKRCLNMVGRTRPTMREVMMELERVSMRGHGDCRQHIPED